MKFTIALALICVAAFSTNATAQLKGDAKRGGKLFRACVACHALRKDVHTTGPSLAGMWGRKAGQVKSFARYSKQLRASGITWGENTLYAWIADPSALVPGTFMRFRGIQKDQDRADLIAFLKLAMAPGGASYVTKKGIVSRDYTEGQIPGPLKGLPKAAQVLHVRHCRDSYFVSTADGRKTPYWEMNVRIKLDTRHTGPEAGKPMIVGAGMAGDRVSIVFSSLNEITQFIVEKC